MGANALIVLGCVVLALAVALVVLLSLARERARRVDVEDATPRASGGADESGEGTTNRRIAGLGIFAGGVIGVLLARLWGMQLVSGDDYSSQAESNRTRKVTTVAPRGRILDRNGEELVTNRPSLTVTAYSDVADDPVRLQLLANVLGMPTVAVKRKVQDLTEGAQTAHTVAMDVSRTSVAFIQAHIDAFDGVNVEQRTQRYYPFGQMATHLLGYTGSVSTEQLEASSKDESPDAIAYEPGDVTGQAGIELQYEGVLQGMRGEQTVFVDANGKVTSYSTSVPAESGSDVVLTIDAKIQKGAEEGLAHGIQAARDRGNPKCNSGAVVVLDATNGDVLAMASAPNYNPEVFSGGISQDDWDAVTSEESGNPMMNRAITGQFVSGSTIKPLVAFAALDYGIATPSSGYDCVGYWTGFGASFGQWCWKHDGHGYQSLQSGITYSCDTVFYEIGKGFYQSEHQDGMQETFRRWGLGEACGIDLPSETSGRVPDAQWKWDYYTSSSDEDRKWKPGDYTNLSIGQGDLLVTPLQMACVYAGIATRGTIWRPHLLKGVRARSGEGLALEYEPQQLRTCEEDSRWFDLVDAGLDGVIYEESASFAAHFTNLSVRVRGKTGTGEHGDDAATGWLCAFAPADNPKYVIAAVIEKGGFGANSAMYAVRDTLGAIYDEPDKSSVELSDSTR